tara:strand:- start:197 stop:376 length:180 start_codon:yes stop_codon:yes gene_type:complete
MTKKRGRPRKEGSISSNISIKDNIKHWKSDRFRPKKIGDIPTLAREHWIVRFKNLFNNK